MTTGRTQLGGWKETVNTQDLPVSPLCFGFTKANKLRPSGVRDSLSQALMLDQARNIQRFKSDYAKIINQLATELMLEVFALVGNLFMDFSNGQARFLSAVAAFNLSAKATLPNLQTPFGLVQMLGLLMVRTITQLDKGFQAQINPDLGRFGFLGFDIHLTLNRDEVAPALGFRDGAILHLAFNCAMKNTLDPTDFGQVNAFPVEFEALGVANRLVSVLAVKVGIVCPTRKEVHVRAIKVFERLLQDLTIRLFEPGIVHLEAVSQVSGAIVVSQARARVQVVAFTHRAIVIVDETRRTELLNKRGLLGLIRVDSALERFADQHWLVSLAWLNTHERNDANSL